MVDLIKPRQPLLVKPLGRRSYEPVWQAMQQFTDAREADTVDELWLVEHDPVYTLGQAGKREHILNPGQIPVVPVDRGGQVTYHGPGQLVVYPLFDIRRMGIGVRDMVCRIEQCVIDVCDDYGIQAERQQGAPGVYVDDAKIAALGLRVRHGRSFHGLAFNVDMDVSPFDGINPCGYAGMAVTQLSEHGVTDSVDAVAERLIEKLAHHFHLVRQ